MYMETIDYKLINKNTFAVQFELVIFHISINNFYPKLLFTAIISWLNLFKYLFWKYSYQYTRIKNSFYYY